MWLIWQETQVLHKTHVKLKQRRFWMEGKLGLRGVLKCVFETKIMCLIVLYILGMSLPLAIRMN